MKQCLASAKSTSQLRDTSWLKSGSQKRTSSEGIWPTEFGLDSAIYNCSSWCPRAISGRSNSRNTLSRILDLVSIPIYYYSLPSLLGCQTDSNYGLYATFALLDLSLSAQKQAIKVEGLATPSEYIDTISNLPQQFAYEIQLAKAFHLIHTYDVLDAEQTNKCFYLLSKMLV